ncbi:MAG: sugar ABC transporter permease, partial [Brachybacterium sp.]|nr:sugar ABC transporter permease [Brachybacterium sp.]
MTTTSAPATPDLAPGQTSEGSRGNPSFRRQAGGAWLFIAPFGLFYFAFLLGPTIWMLITSFFNASTVRSGLGSFAGFDNYMEMFGRSDFWSSLWHTLQFTLYTVPPLVILALIFAILTNRVQSGQWFFRLAFFMPFILPSATISLIWLFIFTPGSGLWATVQSLLGMEPGAGVLASPNTAMIGIAVATI